MDLYEQDINIRIIARWLINLYPNKHKYLLDFSYDFVNINLFFQIFIISFIFMKMHLDQTLASIFINILLSFCIKTLLFRAFTFINSSCWSFWLPICFFLVRAYSWSLVSQKYFTLCGQFLLPWKPCSWVFWTFTSLYQIKRVLYWVYNQIDLKLPHLSLEIVYLFCWNILVKFHLFESIFK